jgi:hypothetical protein
MVRSIYPQDLNEISRQWVHKLIYWIVCMIRRSKMLSLLRRYRLMNSYVMRRKYIMHFSLDNVTPSCWYTPTIDPCLAYKYPIQVANLIQIGPAYGSINVSHFQSITLIKKRTNICSFVWIWLSYYHWYLTFRYLIISSHTLGSVIWKWSWGYWYSPDTHSLIYEDILCHILHVDYYF